ncbi:MAG: hypothetical protein JRJ12_15305 [Deltaproteobacteria bacterium]|nr:hypothetical protein [Deltaproteobacteria bacterium]MBW2072987.1 hypothetical protein [Deltaproteobacteria bacterium]
MDTIGSLKRKVLRQQKQIDALVTTQTFLFGFLCSLANVDMSIPARTLAEMLRDPEVRENQYFFAQLSRLQEMSQSAATHEQERSTKLPPWFHGVIDGGLSGSEKDEEE